MAARTFETLVNDFLNEFGVAGGGPLVTQTGETEAVSGQNAQLSRVIRWVRDSSDYVNNLWTDWNFLWFEYSLVDGLAISTDEPTLPAAYNVKEWDRGSFYLDRTLAEWSQLTYLEWDEFRDSFKLGTQAGSRPSHISQKPDGTLVTSVIADQNYDFYGRGWKRPTRLILDDDTPPLPEEFDRIIICRTGIYYGDKEDAPEILEGCTSEYVDLLEKLEGAQLPGRRYDRMSSQDVELQIEIPGQESLYPTR